MCTHGDKEFAISAMKVIVFLYIFFFGKYYREVSMLMKYYLLISISKIFDTLLHLEWSNFDEQKLKTYEAVTNKGFLHSKDSIMVMDKCKLHL